MTRLNQAFKQIIGKVPTCVRPPFGDLSNPSANILQAMGYGNGSNNGNAGIILWNVDPGICFIKYTTYITNSLSGLGRSCSRDRRCYSNQRYA